MNADFQDFKYKELEAQFLTGCSKTCIHRHSRGSGSPEILKKTGFPFCGNDDQQPKRTFSANMATNIEVGLLLNFGPKPEVKRKAFDNERK
jgi:hypothetical protein